MKLASKVAVLVGTLLVAGSAFAQGESSQLSSKMRKRTQVVRESRSDRAWIPTLAISSGKFNAPQESNAGVANSISHSNEIGFTVGAGYEMRNGRFSLLTGLFYQQEAFKATEEASNQTRREKVTLTGSFNYLSLPILGKFSAPVSRSWRVSMHGGVAPALYLSGKTDTEEEITSGGVTVRKSESGSTGDNMRFINAFAIAGVGIEIPMSHGNEFRTDLTYRRMLMNVTNSSRHVFTEAILANFGWAIDL